MNLETLWFWLAACSFAAYVVLDGFDLGVGLLSRVLARTRSERALVMRSIGPVWDGNEVWLLAAGGTLYFAFPKLYATAIAGFYLPVNILVWLLAFRALGLEMKHQMHHPLWDDLWDAAFFGSSALITLFLGVALGNVVRGLPIDERGTFFAPLWTDFTVSDNAGILDWFTVLVGLTAMSALALHGALWIAHRVEGPPAERAARLAVPLAAATGVAFALTSAAVFSVKTDIAVSARTAIPPFVAALALGAAAALARRGSFRAAFRASAAMSAAMVLTAAAAMYPFVLPSRRPGLGLTIEAAKTSDYGLTVGLLWWIPGTALALGYFVFMYRKLPDVVRATDADAEPHSTAAPRSHSPESE
ncbi:MAG: cytochrome d ubiquinol oxidase subunit II [Polyangiaceae bacterium]